MTALFDRDGRYLAGKENLLELRLLDASLMKLRQSGVTVRTEFDVKRGKYLVRQVVRDAEDTRISALSSTVEIPY